MTYTDRDGYEWAETYSAHSRCSCCPSEAGAWRCTRNVHGTPHSDARDPVVGAVACQACFTSLVWRDPKKPLTKEQVQKQRARDEARKREKSRKFEEHVGGRVKAIRWLHERGEL